MCVRRAAVAELRQFYGVFRLLECIAPGRSGHSHERVASLSRWYLCERTVTEVVFMVSTGFSGNGKRVQSAVRPSVPRSGFQSGFCVGLELGWPSLFDSRIIPYQNWLHNNGPCRCKRPVLRMAKRDPATAW